jgi:hypothetical protein
MYSKNNEYPVLYMPRIRLNDGSTRTGGVYTDEELASAGYVKVSDKPTCLDSEIVEWNTENGQWIIREKTSQEIQLSLEESWKHVIVKREGLLEDSNWTQTGDAFDGVENGDIWASLWGQYRSRLRSIKMTIGSPSDVVWPVPPKASDVINRKRYIEQGQERL